MINHVFISFLAVQWAGAQNSVWETHCKLLGGQKLKITVRVVSCPRTQRESISKQPITPWCPSKLPGRSTMSSGLRHLGLITQCNVCVDWTSPCLSRVQPVWHCTSHTGDGRWYSLHLPHLVSHPGKRKNYTPIHYSIFHNLPRNLGQCNVKM